MSIFTRLCFGAIMFVASAPAFAFGTDTPTQNAQRAPLGVMVAQADGGGLSDSDIRRINHYSDQALTALQAFNTGGNAEDEVAALRLRVQRLVDAGARSGLDLVQTADYFEAYLAEQANAALPGALLDASGRFDARSLFASTMIYFSNLGTQEVDVAAVDEADLAAIGSVAKRLSPQVPAAPQTAQISVVETPVVVLETPVIAPNAPANVRAILERVRLKGDDWVITVQQGDSLGQFANALYGDTLFFQRIFEANQQVLASPNSITVGQELVLPKG